MHLRRAEALATCGYVGGACSPTTGNIVVDAAGRPRPRRFSCRHRLGCPDCVRTRASQTADDLTARIESVRAQLVDAGGWDGRLRQLVLSRQPLMLLGRDEWTQEVVDRRGASLAVEGRALQQAWAALKKEYPRTLKHCAVNEEITYNAEGDFWHVHYHVIVLAPHKVNRLAMLERWQALNGYRVDGGEAQGSRGSLYVNEKKDVKQACKYALKGGAGQLLDLPEHRQRELYNYLKGRRMLRTTGALWRSNDEVIDDETPQDVDDELLTDSETGEVWATSTSMAKKGGAVGVVAWTTHPAARARIREMLYEIARRDLDEVQELEARARWARAGQRRRRRKLFTRVKAKLRRIEQKMPTTSTTSEKQHGPWSAIWAPRPT